MPHREWLSVRWVRGGGARWVVIRGPFTVTINRMHRMGVSVRQFGEKGELGRQSTNARQRGRQMPGREADYFAIFHPAGWMVIRKDLLFPFLVSNN